MLGTRTFSTFLSLFPGTVDNVQLSVWIITRMSELLGTKDIPNNIKVFWGVFIYNAFRN